MASSHGESPYQSSRESNHRGRHGQDYWPIRETDPKTGTGRELSRRLKERPRGVFLWPVPVSKCPLAQQGGLLTPWRIVQDRDERATRAC